MARRGGRVGPRAPADARADGAPGARPWHAAPPPHALAAALAGAGLVLGLAGVVMAFRYSPTPSAAHASVAAMQAGALRLVRSAHAWAASAVLALALLLVARGWALDRFRAMGRGRSLAAVGLLAVLVGTYASGTVLPWDQRGWEAFQHAADGAALVGVDVGVADDPRGTPLGVVFWVHVLAVPAALAVALAFHLRAGRHLREGAYAHGRVAAAAGVGVLVLAALAPPALGPAPVRLLTVSIPHWPFLWLVPLQDAIGEAALLALPLAFALLAAAVLLPPPRRRGLALGAVALVFGILTFLGAR